jgi:hypothetical protein
LQNWLRFADNNFTGSIPSSLANTAQHMSQVGGGGACPALALLTCPALPCLAPCNAAWHCFVQCCPVLRCCISSGPCTPAADPCLLQVTLDGNDFEGDLYALSDHSMINFNAANNPRIVRPCVSALCH